MSFEMSSRRAVLAAGAALAIAVPVAGALGAAQVLATSPSPDPPLHTTILAQSTFAPLLLRARATQPALWKAVIKTRGLSDVYVVDNKFGAKGATTGWHSHAGPSLVFVVAGTITNYTTDAPGCAPRSYGVGQSFVDPGGDDAHMLRNESDVPAETIAVQFLPHLSARRIDVPQVPRGCPA